MQGAWIQFLVMELDPICYTSNQKRRKKDFMGCPALPYLFLLHDKRRHLI